MKYTLGFTLFLLPFSVLFAQDKGFTISGTVKKYPDNTIAYLLFNGQKGRVTDSSAVNAGSFSFKGTVDEPRPAKIVFKERGNSMLKEPNVIAFYIEPGDLVFASTSTLNKSNITGSPATNDKIKFDKTVHLTMATNPPQQVRVTTVSKVVKVTSKDGTIPEPPTINPASLLHDPSATKTTKMTDISNLPLEIQSHYAELTDEAKEKASQFIKDHPAAFVSLYTVHALWNAKQLEFAEYIQLLNGLDPVLKESNAEKAGFDTHPSGKF